MNYSKTATKGKWIIAQTHTVELKKFDARRSLVNLSYYRNVKICDISGRIYTDAIPVEETFKIAGFGKRAIENIISVIEQGGFQ